MLDKLEAIKERFDEVGELIVQPDAMADMKRYSRLSKEYKDLSKIVDKYLEYKSTLDSIEEAREILDTEKDPEFSELFQLELSTFRDTVFEETSVRQFELEYVIRRGGGEDD